MPATVAYAAIWTVALPQAHAMADAPDALVFGELGYEAAETSVAVHPEDVNIVLATSMLRPLDPEAYTFDVGAFISTDAGATWLPTLSVSAEPEGSADDDYADPVAAWVKTGTSWSALVVYLTQSSALHIAMSTDLGQSWDTHEVFDSAGESTLDKPWIAASHDGDGMVYVAFMQRANPISAPLTIVLARSTDGGTTWSSPARLGGAISGGHHLPSISIGPDGEVYVAWAVFQSATGTVGGEKAFAVVRSTDHGVTWSTPSAPVVTGIQGCFSGGANAPPVFFNHNSTPALAVDRSLGAGRGTVYIAWTNVDPAGDPGILDDDTNVYIVGSTDGGASFGSWTRMNATTADAQWSVWLSCDPVTGALASIWYHHDVGLLFDAADDEATVHCGVSADGGQSWTESAVSDVTFHPTPLAQFFMGDYIGIDASGGLAVPVWADARSGINRVYTSPFMLDWSGTVKLARDFLVPPGKTLNIHPGTTVLAQANVSPGIEILVRGKLVAEGEAAEQRIKFTTFGGTGAPGEWRGIGFEDSPDTSVSSISQVDFEAATFAVEVDSLSGNIFQCKFTNSSEADVYVKQDTRIPAGSSWLFTQPARVKIATKANDATPPGRSFGEDGDGVEVLVDGILTTEGPFGPSSQDSVWFEPYRPTSSPTDEDWLGITLGGDGPGELILRGAVVVGAEDPIVIEHGWFAEVKHSTIHTYLNNGIVDYGVGVSVVECVIDGLEAGEDGDTGPGSGVLLMRSTGYVASNQIAWHRNDGVTIAFVKADCDNSMPPDTLRVTGNTLTGEGNQSGTFDSGSGIGITWGCSHRHVRIEENTITNWYDNGVKMVQCADTRLTCNAINENGDGIRHERNTSQQGGANRLWRNTIHSNAVRNVHALEPTGLKLGGVAQAGDNDLQPMPQRFNLKKLPIGSPDLGANNCMWRDAAGALLTTDATIRATFDPPGLTTVAITGFYVEEEPVDCGVSAQAQPLSAVLDPEDAGEISPGDHALGASSAQTLPERTELQGAVPNPGRGTVMIRLDIAAGAGESAILEVYDVVGRKVKILMRGQVPPGRHRVLWDGRSDAGLRVAPGVYFLRMRTRDFHATRKVTILQ